MSGANNYKIIGWDIGGAHVKAAVVDEQGTIIRVVQQPCPLWQGLEELQKVVKIIVADIDLTRCKHAITMTGELVDLFASRLQGVQQIIELMDKCLGNENTLFYAGNIGFLKSKNITDQHLQQIASANWLASVSYVAQYLEAGLFVDIGSTTSDIILFSQSQSQAQGFTDYQRLCTGELVYTGIIRTPVMALTRTVDFQEQRVGLMVEYFATMADVYRITGELDEYTDQVSAADNGDKTTAASYRRLARMIGCDDQDFSYQDWQQLALQLKNQQLQQLQQACLRQLNRELLPENSVLVGAGVGKFLARQLATILGLAYQDLSEIIANGSTETEMDITDCLPAVAVACLAKTLF